MIPDTKEPAVKAPSPYKFAADLAAGGVAGGVSKTAVAPIERVKLILQTQDSNPRIKSGEIPPYTGVLPSGQPTCAWHLPTPCLCACPLHYIMVLFDSTGAFNSLATCVSCCCAHHEGTPMATHH